MKKIKPIMTEKEFITEFCKLSERRNKTDLSDLLKEDENKKPKHKKLTLDLLD